MPESINRPPLPSQRDQGKSGVFARCAARFAQHRLLGPHIYFLKSLKMMLVCSAGHGGDRYPLGTKTLQSSSSCRPSKGTHGMLTGACRCRERDPVPACVFGRVCLTSCQINIYSQIYLFAFVAENSCGLGFFCVCCFVPLVYFWLRSAGERGCYSFCWLQLFQLLLPTHGFEHLLQGGTQLAALLWLGTVSLPVCPWAGGDDAALTLASVDGSFPRWRNGSRWMRSAEEIRWPPDCGDSTAAGSGPGRLLCLRLLRRLLVYGCAGSVGQPLWVLGKDRASPPVAGAAWIAACRAASPQPSLPVRPSWESAWASISLPACRRTQVSPSPLTLLFISFSISL